MCAFEAYVSARPGGKHADTQRVCVPKMCWRVQALVCCLREPCGKVQSHKQWPQCSSNRLTGTHQRTRGQSDCKSLCYLCTDKFFTDPFSIPCSVHVFDILDCNSLLLTVQFPVTLTPEVEQCSLLSSCQLAMSVWFARALFFCTFSVEACEFVTWSARLWECNAHDWLKIKIVSRIKIGRCIHMSRMLAHERSTFFSLFLILDINLSGHVADQ